MLDDYILLGSYILLYLGDDAQWGGIYYSITLSTEALSLLLLNHAISIAIQPRISTYLSWRNYDHSI